MGSLSEPPSPSSDGWRNRAATTACPAKTNVLAASSRSTPARIGTAMGRADDGKRNALYAYSSSGSVT